MASPITNQRRALSTALTLALLPSLRAQESDALSEVRSGALVLREGLKGNPSVEALQRKLGPFLRAQGMESVARDLKPDGNFGPKTRAAVGIFQSYISSDKSLGEIYTAATGSKLFTPDYAVGRGTIAALESYLARLQGATKNQDACNVFIQSLSQETAENLGAKLRVLSPQQNLEASIRSLSRAIGINWSGEQLSGLQELCRLPKTGEIDKGTSELLAQIISAAWYRKLVTDTNPNYEWKSSPGSANIVGLRGYHMVTGSHGNRFGEWNDTIAIIRYDGKGVPSVKEFRATTDPGKKTHKDSPDVDRDGNGDVAHLIPGQYEFTVGRHKGAPGALVPDGELPVYRDLNHNGKIDTDPEQKTRTATGIHIHWTSRDNPPHVGGESLGCQVPLLDRAAFREAFTAQLSGSVRYTLIDLTRKN